MMALGLEPGDEIGLFDNSGLLSDDCSDNIGEILVGAGVYTGDLINQARAYLMDWEPEVIIVGSGINDSRPKSLSTELKNNLIVSKFKVIKKFLEIIQKFIFLMNSTKSSVEKCSFSFIRVFPGRRVEPIRA